MMIQEMLKHKTKPKCKTLGLTLEQSLDILDVDKNPYAYRAEKRGAIDIVRKYLDMKQIVSMELLNAYDTCQCKLYVYKTRTTVMNETLMVLVSIHKNVDKVNVRFGNECQLNAMLKSYRNKTELDGFKEVEKKYGKY